MTKHDVQDRRVYAAGEVIFKEGEIGRACAFLVQNGKVEISKKGPDGNRSVLGYITDGGIFGEMALIDNKGRMAMACAVEPTAVVIITQAAFEERLRRTDPFVRGLLNIFVQNIRDMTDRALAGRG